MYFNVFPNSIKTSLTLFFTLKTKISFSLTKTFCILFNTIMLICLFILHITFEILSTLNYNI